MATVCNLTEESILDFLKERGGKVKNTDLTEHFKAVFPEEPQKKAAVRNTFKSYVNNVAYVKSECGVKYVCLKKKFRGSVKGEQRKSSVSINERRSPADCAEVYADDAARPRAPGTPITPGSGYGNDSQVRLPPVATSTTPYESKPDEFVCVVERPDGEMGNRLSFHGGSEEAEKEEEVEKEAPDIPVIAVIEPSPLPAEGSVFTMPGPAQTGHTGQVDSSTHGEVEPPPQKDPEEAEQAPQEGGTQLQSEERSDELLDAHSLSESEGNTSPSRSRRHFIELMMNSSPQVRRSMVLRNSVCLSSRSDSDTSSLVSSCVEDDRASIALDPLEHEWMMCASDAEWSSLHRLLLSEPSLVLRKDFVSGFTCLHWAAKHDKPELLALIVNFAKQHNIGVSVDVRSNCGYTPLHIAAMHNHMEVVKLLVGAYDADVDIRDYSGKKACQYLTLNTSVDIRDIIGAYERSESENPDHGGRGRWRFSKVLQGNLKPLRLLSPGDSTSLDGDVRPREKPIRRKSSFSRMKPKLEKLRWRTSQVVHSVSFRGAEDLGGSTRDSFKSRPKTHFFE